MTTETSTTSDARPDDSTAAGRWFATTKYAVLAVALTGVSCLLTYYALATFQGIILHFGFWVVTLALVIVLNVAMFFALTMPAVPTANRLDRWRSEWPGAISWTCGGALVALAIIGLGTGLNWLEVGLPMGSIDASLVDHPVTTAVTVGSVSFTTLFTWSLDIEADADEADIPDPEYIENQRVQVSSDPSNTTPNSMINSSQSQRNTEAPTSSSPPEQSNAPTDSNNPISGGNFEFDWQQETNISMDDVGGMEDVKAELQRKVIRPLTTDREKAEALDIPASNILFYGPPGTGKTYIAQALATELGLPFIRLSGADVQSKWINASAGKVDTLFSEATLLAEREGGAVIFLDELDSVLKNRSDNNAHKEDSKVVNEFLGHLQEAKESNIVFIGATNRREDLDPAAIRRGRIDKEIEIGYPDVGGRKAILQAQLQGRNHEVADRELMNVAKQMEGFSAADLEGLVEDAARIALFEREDDVITLDDLNAAFNNEQVSN